MDTDAMTLAQLKDLLSTYGVNDAERDAPVRVDINGTTVNIIGAEVDYEVSGTSVLLLAEAVNG